MTYEGLKRLTVAHRVATHHDERTFDHGKVFSQRDHDETRINIDVQFSMMHADVETFVEDLNALIQKHAI